MKREMNLVGSILLRVEEEAGLCGKQDKGWRARLMTVDGYDQDAIFYHIKMMIDSGYLDGKTHHHEGPGTYGGGNDMIMLFGMTWRGREFSRNCS